MKTFPTRRRAGVTLAICLAALATAPLSALTRPQVAALDGVKPGLWQLSSRDGGPSGQRMCIADPGALVQLEHRASPCSRMVIADRAHDATVHYSCPGAGWGRTSLRVVSSDTVSIETQGISDRAPFAYRTEARRTGNCGR